MVLLTEEELIEGVRYCLEELHLVVEPGGGAGISALLAGKVEIKSGPVCVVVSGSNLDKKYFKEALGLQWKDQRLKLFFLSNEISGN